VCRNVHTACTEFRAQFMLHRQYSAAHISTRVHSNYFTWQLLFVICRSNSSAVSTVGITGTLARYTSRQEVSDNRQRSNKIPVRKDVKGIHSNPEANKPASQHVQLAYRLAISHVTSASHTTTSHCQASPKTMLSVAVRTLTLPVQTVRMSTFPVQCKDKPRDRPIPHPGNRTSKRLRKKGGGRNCDELSGRRRRR
jgi:hypothetical protein